MRIHLHAASVGISLLAFHFILFCSCNNQANRTPPETPVKKQAPAKRFKYPSSFKDTLWITTPAAVFFHPDSIQLQQFGKTSSHNVYESTTHESFFQMRNSRIVLKKYWPRIRILEAHQFRYLVFRKSDRGTTIIDLDKQPNLYGLYLFHPGKEPELADMMNIETALGFYFK